MLLNLTERPRRNRHSAAIRALAHETLLVPSQLVAPLFVIEGKSISEPILSLPGISRLSIDALESEVAELYSYGIRAIDLFAYIPKDKRNSLALEAVREGNLLQRAVKHLKENFPELCVMVDIALDPYTDHGHDGLLNCKGDVDNDSTLKVLGEMAVGAADAGADIIAPSDMMDGRVGYLRRELDQKGFSHVLILSYAAKYASSLYGPFRSALDSAPKLGDKKSYQLNPANSREALREIELDIREGADMLLVKPATLYLDILAKARAMTYLPLGAYHVSGEYAMVMAAWEKGWIDGPKVMEESLLAIKRAGADFILTYGAKLVAKQMLL